jgi:hypothetical protein
MPIIFNHKGHENFFNLKKLRVAAALRELFLQSYFRHFRSLLTLVTCGLPCYAIVPKNFVFLEKILKTFIHGLSVEAGSGYD